MSAEQAFQKGMALLRDGSMSSAAIELRRASELLPESLEYQLYATWAKARSYREVPLESDQQMLREIADKAKRHDPMFAFASYVLGQLAMWAGDEAAAKKWFYEALRLDPASDAGKQVRILARRGMAAPPGPKAPPPLAAKEPPERVTISNPTPAVHAGPPPVPAAARVQPSPSRAPSRSGRRWFGAFAALLGTAAIVIFALARKPAPGAEPEPIASPPPAVSVESPPSHPPGAAEHKDTSASPGGPVPGATASALEPAEAKKEVKAAPEKEDSDTGTLVLPARASGHRIFVDGRRAQTDGTEPLRLRCGAHVVQIGSGGTSEHIEIPCGGELQLQ
jgi:hypothetical protein